MNRGRVNLKERRWEKSFTGLLKLLTILIDFLIFVPFFKQSIAYKRTSNGERFFPSSVLYLSLFFELRILNFIFKLFTQRRGQAKTFVGTPLSALRRRYEVA